MEGALNNGMCRCCASEGTFKDVSSKYQWMGEDEVYSDMLRECFDITLTNAEEGQDGGICEVCITQLRNAANFKKQVLVTEEQFKKGLQDHMFKNDIIKVEVNALDEDGNTSDNHLSDDYSGPEYEVPIKEELDDTRGKKRSKATTSRAKKAKLEGDSSKSRQGYDRQIPAKNKENIINIMSHSNASLIKSKTAKGYSCFSCPESFEDPKDLKNHFRATHISTIYKIKLDAKSRTIKIDITGLQCNICSEGFDKLELFGKHLEKHNITMHLDVFNLVVPYKFDSEAFKCAICDKECNNFKNLREHTNKHYRNFVCDICNAGFIIRQLLRHHKKIHLEELHKCCYCEKVYKSKEILRNHERMVHMGHRYLKCSVCTMEFTNNRTKMNHMAKEHGVYGTPYACKICDKVFAVESLLFLHRKRYHKLDYQCDLCGELSRSKKALAVHMKSHLVQSSVKRNKKKYKCVLCGELSRSKKSLAVHMKTHIVPSSGKRYQKDYKCDLCGELSRSKKSLAVHMKSH